MQLVLALLCLSIGIGAVVSAIRDPRVDRSFVIRSFIAIGLMLCYGVAGVAALVFLAPVMEGGAAAAAVIYLVSWYGAGVLLMVDRAPRLAPYPDRVRKQVRRALLLLILIAVGSFLWLSVSF